ncbi:MAG TPA: universal stress protein, partial [Acidimicrobiales bacterium]|nr:universal stress protein [Acidimicrobiales bacterium]
MGVREMYTSIVVGTDGSETAGVAVDHAAALAKAFGSTLHVVSAYRPPSVAVALAPEAMAAFAAVNADEEARANVQERLRTLSERLTGRGITVKTHPVAGAAADAILDAAARLDADLIV